MRPAPSKRSGGIQGAGLEIDNPVGVPSVVVGVEYAAQQLAPRLALFVFRSLSWL
jgi:hypothetical protein